MAKGSVKLDDHRAHMNNEGGSVGFLIHCGAGIGSVVQQTAFAEQIKTQRPDSRIDLLVAGNASKLRLAMQVIESQHAINRIYYYNIREPLHNVALIAKLKKNHYDFGIVTVETTASRRSLWPLRIMKVAGCKTIVGSGYDGIDVSVNIPVRTHYSDRQNMYLDVLGLPAISKHSVIDEKKLPMDWAKSLIAGTNRFAVALVPGTKPYSSRKHNRGEAYDVKSWGLEKGLKLARRFTDNDMDVYFIGGNAEREQMQRSGLCTSSCPRFHDFVGKTTVKESMALLKCADIVIGSEGGMLHCAAACGIDTLTIFGGTDYRTLRPRGDGCDEFIHSDLSCYPCFGMPEAAECRHHRCLERISVDMVYSKAMDMLTRRKGAVCN